MNWKLYIDDDGLSILDLMRGHDELMSCESYLPDYKRRLEAAIRMAKELGMLIQDDRVFK